VREAVRRYADRRIAPDLRVYVSTDLVPDGMSAITAISGTLRGLTRSEPRWSAR